jgi:hypothetical protein
VLEQVVGLEVESGGEGKLSANNRGKAWRWGLEAARGEVELRVALIDEGDVDFDEVVEAGEGAAAKAVAGLPGATDGVPEVTLPLGEGAPAGGDGAEGAADGALRRGAGVEGDKKWVANLAVTIALPDEAAAFARLGVRLGHKHLYGELYAGRRRMSRAREMAREMGRIGRMGMIGEMVAGAGEKGEG